MAIELSSTAPFLCHTLRQKQRTCLPLSLQEEEPGRVIPLEQNDAQFCRKLGEAGHSSIITQSKARAADVKCPSRYRKGLC